MKIFKNPNYDFVRWTWPALALSWIIILAGGLFVWNKGIPLGVEFSGGTIVVIDFEQAPDLDKIRAALPGGGANAVVQSYGPADLRQVMIRVPDAGAESGGDRKRGARRQHLLRSPSPAVRWGEKEDAGRHPSNFTSARVGEW